MSRRKNRPKRQFWRGKDCNGQRFRMKKNSGDIECMKCLLRQRRYQQDRQRTLQQMMLQQWSSKYQRDIASNQGMTLGLKKWKKILRDRASIVEYRMHQSNLKMFREDICCIGLSKRRPRQKTTYQEDNPDKHLMTSRVGMTMSLSGN